MLTPKEFLLHTNALYTKTGGVYTVLPLYKKGFFDLPFHINRLYQSYNLLYHGNDNIINNEKLSYNDVELLVRESIHDSKYKHNNKITKHSTGMLTLSMGKKIISNDIEIDCMFTSKEYPYSPNICNEYYVDFAQFQRYPMQAKYINWIQERSIIEKDRLSFINETILYQYNNHNNISINQTPKTLLTEGLISNLFILNKDNQILTCPDDMVLSGSVSKLIKIICKLYNIPLVETLIDLKDINIWNGMFISNAVKNIQNVDGFYLNNDLILQLQNIRSTLVPSTIINDNNYYNIYKFNNNQKTNTNKIIQLIHNTINKYLYSEEQSEIDVLIEKLYDYPLWENIL